MMEFMGPETLSTLRSGSEELQAQVDDYLEHLIDSGKLTDRQGRTVRSGVLEPSEVLQNWSNEWILIDYQPPSEADVAALQQRFDEVFRGMGINAGDYEFLYHDENGNELTELQVQIGVYEGILGQGDEYAEKLEDQLNIYFQNLLNARRIVDKETGNPLPPDTQFWEVMKQLREGDALWFPPPPPAPPLPNRGY
jgi:hypothetical protein